MVQRFRRRPTTTTGTATTRRNVALPSLSLILFALAVAAGGGRSSAFGFQSAVPNHQSRNGCRHRSPSTTSMSMSAGKPAFWGGIRPPRGNAQETKEIALSVATAASLPDLSSTTVDAPSASEQVDAGSPKVGILLLNLGGPETGDDVEGFLYNLFADPDIIRLPKPLAPFQPLVAYLISKRRAPKSREAYNSIGGGSPILKYTNAQADLLSSSLRDRYGIEAKTYVGMRYWYPFTEQALDAIRADNIDALVVLPLYPQFSISTSGSSLRVLQEEFAKHADVWGPSKMLHTVVPSWHDRPGYVSAVAKLIRTELESYTPEELAEGADAEGGCARHVLFSAHGVPRSYIEAGDPYRDQIEECVASISDLLPGKDDGVQVHLSFQSRVGPVEWLRPYTDDVLPSLGERGVKNLVVVPISFVSEHIETLEEIDIEYRELALESGITNWRRVPALNTDPDFINDMADLVVDALNQPAQTVTEACVSNNVNVVDDLGDDEYGGMSGGLIRGTAPEIASGGVQGVGADNELRARRSSSFSSSSSSSSTPSSSTSRTVAASAATAAVDVDPIWRRLKWGEIWNGRMAVLFLLSTVLWEVASGQPIARTFGL